MILSSLTKTPKRMKEQQKKTSGVNFSYGVCFLLLPFFGEKRKEKVKKENEHGNQELKCSRISKFYSKFNVN